MTGPRTYNPADWKPGDVALVTWWNAPEGSVRVRCIQRASGRETPVWWGADGYLGDGSVTAARPLVPLDPESDEDVERLRKEYDRHLAASAESGSTYAAFLTSGDQRTAALRAALRALARPPKPDEPTGDTAVVVDRDGRVWHREGNPAAAGLHRWWSGAVVREWDALDVPPDGVKFGGVS